LASLVVAAIELGSQSRHSSSPSTAPSTPTDDQRWNSLGYVDIDGGITPLYPIQPGRVMSIEARENERVKAGQPLFHLEDTIPANKVHQAEAALKAAQGQLAFAEKRVVEADKQIAAQEVAIEAANRKVNLAQIALNKQKRFNRQEIGVEEELQNAEVTVQLAKDGVKAEQRKLDAAKAAKRVAETLVVVARDGIEGKQAQLDEARNAVKECVVRAPVDGTPLRILVNVGEVLGNNPRQPAIQFAANRPLLVRAEVGQEFVGHVREDQSVVIEDHVIGQECARGRVRSLASWYAPRRTATPEMFPMNNDAPTVECIIQIESNTQVIRIGQRVRVKFPS
jgi:membrane fusion protein (multidrug efflux system)